MALEGLWALPLAALVAGATVYSLLAAYATLRYLRDRQALPEAAGELPPVSILAPLAGVDAGLEANLRSFLEQDYPCFEVVFAVRFEDEYAAGVARKLIAEYPHVASRLLVTGPPDWTNAKVFALDHLLREARHELIVMLDSDVRVGPGLLRALAREFSDPRLGLATCPYRAVPEPSLWSRLEALAINTHFFAGVLSARLLEGMKFALGPGLAIRRAVFEEVGGAASLRDYLAEDFILGKRVFEAGHGVILSSFVIGHHIGGPRFAENLLHRIRWARSNRRSRPKGYWGELFTHPLPPSLLLWALFPAWWPLAAAALAGRFFSAALLAAPFLADPLARRRWWLLPASDLLAFLVWLTGFFGRTVIWRNRRYELQPDGRMHYLGDG
jgi:ceramide glucosyltransferase